MKLMNFFKLSSQRSSDDPYLPTPNIGLFKRFRMHAWFRSSYIFIQAIILIGFVACVFDKWYFAISTVMKQKRAFWLNIMMTITPLQHWVKYMHTLLSCDVGISKFYIVHITFIEALIYFGLSIITISNLYNGRDMAWTIANFVVSWVRIFFIFYCAF